MHNYLRSAQIKRRKNKYNLTNDRSNRTTPGEIESERKRERERETGTGKGVLEIGKGTSGGRT